MKEILSVTIFIVLLAAFILFLPYMGYFVFHTWDNASDWNCRYHGGQSVATTSAFGGLATICKL